MFLIYSFLYTVGFLLLLPRFLFDALRKGKYAAGFWQRLGYLPEFERNSQPVLWIHAVSVGETNAAKPLVEKILEKYPDYRLIISTTTETGQNLARQLFKNKAEQIFYLPFDWCFTVRRALKHFKPNIILIMETELWFNFIRESGIANARIFLVNGRISEKSLNRYFWIKKMIRRVFNYVDLALMQDKADAKRLLKLGVKNKKIKITGNIKFDQKVDTTQHLKTEYFRDRFAISPDAPLIAAASTHEPEERWILEAFKTVWKNSTDELPRLLIAPRHPERFSEVAKLIEQTGFVWCKSSDSDIEKDETAEIILLDSIGELRAFFPLAAIVFVGGSLIPHGGQNILEPALTGNAIVTGFYTMNFKAIVGDFLKNQALIQLPELKENEIPEKLAEVFTDLLQDVEKRLILRHNTRAIVSQNVGATEKTVEYLKPWLEVHYNRLTK